MLRKMPRCVKYVDMLSYAHFKKVFLVYLVWCLTVLSGACGGDQRVCVSVQS